MTRAEILNNIENERSRHFELPGSEMDVKNTPNEWAAIAAHYLTDEVRRGGHKPSRAAFEQSFIKAAAVILAALECSDSISSMGYFSDEPADSLGDALSKIESMTSPE
jgi:hypothetical protein